MERILIDISSLCHMLSIGKTKAFGLINEGRLDIVKLGRRTLVTAESVERLIDESRVSQ